MGCRTDRCPRRRRFGEGRAEWRPSGRTRLHLPISAALCCPARAGRADAELAAGIAGLRRGFLSAPAGNPGRRTPHGTSAGLPPPHQRGRGLCFTDRRHRRHHLGTGWKGGSRVLGGSGLRNHNPVGGANPPGRPDLTLAPGGSLRYLWKQKSRGGSDSCHIVLL